MEPVVISGIGVVSALGHSVDELVRRVGEVRSGADPAGLGEMVEIPLGAVPADRRARVGRMDRLCRAFMAASYRAMADAGLTFDAGSERVGLSFGTGLGCLLTDEEYYHKVVSDGPSAASPRLFAYTVSSAAAGEVSIALGIKGPNVTSHMGFAAGCGALGYGFDLIQLDKADVVLVGGGDVIGPALIEGLRDMHLLKSPTAARPFRDTVAGVTPAEATVVAVLERRERAVQRGARRWLRVAGYAAGFEPTLTKRCPERTGVTATMRRALTDGGIPATAVDVVFSSAHGTVLDEVELSAARETLGAASAALVGAPKAVCGETFGASGMVAVALAAGVLQGQVDPPPGPWYTLTGIDVAGEVAAARLATASVVMVNSLCYSGNVVSVILARDGS